MKPAYTTMAACAFLGVVAGIAAGDEVQMLTGLSYANVRVTDVKDGQIVFSLSSGRRIEKELSEVKQITIADQEVFNNAEKLLAEGKAADAVESYDKLAKDVSQKWMQELVRYRRFEALKQAPLLTRAVKEWMTIVENSKYSKKSLAMKPTKFAEAGSDDNVRAIKELETRIGSPPSDASKEYITTLKQLLLDLYQLEGQDEKAAKLAGELTGSTSKPSDSDETGPVVKNTGAQLKGITVLVDQGKAQQALEIINDNMKLYSAEELPLAMLLRGKAKTILADKKSGEESQQMRLSGGLDFMRVFVYYPSSKEAPEALYLVGVMHTLLETPNEVAADKVFRRVIREYPTSAFAKKAKAALEKLNKE